MRPIDGLVFGHIGDRLGRKKALQLSVLMMALPTTCLGLVPAYARIGFAAPVMLIVLRLITQNHRRGDKNGTTHTWIVYTQFIGHDADLLIG